MSYTVPNSKHIHSIASCPICFLSFNNTSQAPILLTRCGHTICKSCIHRIHENTYHLNCPICRCRNRHDLESLPINFALLDLKVLKTFRCSSHELDFMAFCTDDETLICGACVLSHKTHKCYLLTDPILNSFAEKQREKYANSIEKLEKCKIEVKGRINELRDIMGEIQRMAEGHKENVLEMEKTMIQELRNGADNWKKSINFGEARKIVQFVIELREKVDSLENRIRIMKEKYERFDELSMSEKLSREEKVGIVRNGHEIEIKDLAKNLLGTITESLDYAEAIKTANFPPFPNP
jgi:hypothetical protein